MAKAKINFEIDEEILANAKAFVAKNGGSLSKKSDKNRPRPPNLGELSIQSLLIDVQLSGSALPPVILFEDSWFLRNHKGLAKPRVLVGTEAFLINAERLKLIKSAKAARAAISTVRPTAYAGIDTLNL